MTHGNSLDPSGTDGPVLATDASTGVDPATFGQGHLVRVRRLERLLTTERKWSIKTTRQLHATMLKDVREAEGRARQAEKVAARAERRLARVQGRLEAAQAELAEVRDSATWKAGRVVVGVPARLKRIAGR